MTFTQSIKKEITEKPIKERHCRKAFIAGLIRGSGILYERNGQLGLEFSVANEESAMMISSSFSSLFNYDIREVSVVEDKLNKKDKFILNISGERTVEILEELEIFKEENGEIKLNLDFYGDITKRECCFKSFLRGLFVASGSCIVPTDTDKKNTGYHLEINFTHEKTAIDTRDKLLEYGIKTKVTNRRDGYIMYIKSVEEIKDFLAFLPCPVSVLKLTDLMINREINNMSNRQKNCDLGNVTKQVNAAQKQISAINKIKENMGLKNLKDDLFEVAILRVDNPEDTLQELSEKLGISKSCLNHRLRRLVAIADEL